jgi:hypothetical protein
VQVPSALARKYPQAPLEFKWQWVFPASRAYVDPQSNERRQHHVHETALQRAVRAAVVEAQRARWIR